MKLRLLASIVAVIGLGALAGADEVNFKVTVDAKVDVSKLNVTAKLTRTTTAQKGVTVRLDITTIATEPGTAPLKGTDSWINAYDKEGRLRSTEVVHVSSVGSEDTVATLSSNGVDLKRDAADGKATGFVALPTPWPQATWVLWFDQTHPTVGTKETYSTLNPATGKFTQSTATYLRDENLTIRGQSVATHVVAADNATYWVDDKGLWRKIVQVAKLPDGPEVTTTFEEA